MTERIYLDHAATTPLRPEARAAMEPFLTGDFGNPSSLHQHGRRAKNALDAARDTLASALGAKFPEVTFTSGGTESDNAALVGVLLAHRARGDHLVTTQIEHEAVLDTARFLETLGFRVTFLPTDAFGRVSPESVADALTDKTTLVSVMHANNEVGTIQPMADIAAVCRARGVLLHSDAVQTLGQLPITVDSLGVDLLSVSGHKIGGPKGVGALFVRSGVPIEPFVRGGGQERGRRAGTENVAAVVGFAEAVRLLLPERDVLAARLSHLRDHLISSLFARLPGLVTLNGHPTDRLPNNVHVSLPGLDSETLLLRLDRAGISASSGSACTSGSLEPSHVLAAMGVPETHLKSGLRLTLGRETTDAESDRTVEVLAEIVGKLRK